MGKICIIKSCPSGRKSKNKTNDMPQFLSFFMPKTSERLANWRNSLGINLKATDYVCHRHFKEEDIKMYEKITFNGIPKFFPLGKKMLKENAIPTIEHQFTLTLVKELQENIIDAQQESNSNSNCFIEEQQRHIEQKACNNFIQYDHDYDEQIQENFHQLEIRHIKKYSKHEHTVEKTVESVDLTDYGKNIPLMPPFWLYIKKLKGLEFIRMDPSSRQIKNHIRLNENLSITVIFPNNEEVLLNERITSFDNIYNYLKSVERWLICVGTQIEKKKYSKNCKRVIFGDDAYQRCPMNPRCKCCRMMRSRLQKVSSTPSTIDKSIAKKQRTENLERKCKRLKISQGSPSYEALEDENGQEEWLSEGLLTDDDCNTTMENMNISQESRNSQQSDEQANDTEDSQTNIEEKLNNLENSQNEQEEGHVTKGKQGSDEDSKNSKDDGNDTDDLLRMLGDEDNKKKKKVLKVTNKKLHQESSGEDDEFEFFENAKKAKHLKLAKNVLIKSHPAKKAVPEDSDTDMEDASDKNNRRVNNSRPQSSDGANVVKRMFGVRKVNVASKSTAKSSLAYITDRVNNTPGAAIATRSKMKPDQVSKSTPGSPQTRKAPQKPGEVNRVSQSSRTQRILAAQSQVVQIKSTPNKKKQEEQAREEKILKEDQRVVKSKGHQGPVSENEESKKTHHQLMMSPEQMDEEMLSDEESQSEIGSICDEMPLSESDDTEDWFTLDIRAERAGEYLPLLGPVAHQLLLEEKARVTTKLAQMRESLTEVTEKSRTQANLLKNASTTLTQLEAIISST